MNEKIEIRPKNLLLGFVFAASIVLLAWFISINTKEIQGGAPSGLYAGTSSIDDVIFASTTAGTLFQATANCTSRVVSTASTTIQISFGSSTPSATRGAWQGASTTVAYDGEIYGCGYWRVYGFQNGAISVWEFR